MHSPAPIFLTLAFLILAGSLGWGTAAADESPRRNLRYQMETNLPYRSGNDLTDGMKERCRLDVYHPVGTTQFPTVVWFHGGGLTGGEKSVPAALQNQGIAVVAAGYRLSPQVHAPAYIEDAAAAVAWTFRHIGNFGGDTNRIFVSGHSAGGYLAMMVGLDKRWLAAHGIDANTLAGLVPYSGQAITHFTIRAERGIPETRPVIDEYAPVYHVRADAPPLLILSGDRELELLGRYEENAYFWRMMHLAGHTNTVLHEFGGYGHGAMAEPGHPLLLQFVRKVSAGR